MQSGATLAEVQELASDVDGSVIADLVAALVDSGVVTAMAARARTRAASIRIHGSGPLSDLLASALRCSGARIKHSSLRHAAVTADTTDLVVLSDSLVIDPRCCASCTPRGYPTCRCGSATAPVWSGRWCYPA